MTTQSNYINFDSLVLPFEKSAIMDFNEPLIETVGDQTVVGYLTDADRGWNPCSGDDENGRILVCDDQSDHRKIQEAMGLNFNWRQDLRLVELKFADQLRFRWLIEAKLNAEFIAWAKSTAKAEDAFSTMYFASRAQKFLQETGGFDVPPIGAMSVWDFEFTDKITMELWRELVESGSIGILDAVVLDRVEQSGVKWSVSSEGEGPLTNVFKGCGLWVPTEEAQAEILRREKVYDHGAIVERAGKYLASLDDADAEESSFETWEKAFQWLTNEVQRKGLSSDVDASDPKIVVRSSIGRVRARNEYVNGVLEIYNDWANGNVYGVIVATFKDHLCNCSHCQQNGTEVVDCYEVWDIIGSDNAIAALKDEMEFAVKQLKGEMESAVKELKSPSEPMH